MLKIIKAITYNKYVVAIRVNDAVVEAIQNRHTMLHDIITCPDIPLQLRKDLQESCRAYGFLQNDELTRSFYLKKFRNRKLIYSYYK